MEYPDIQLDVFEVQLGSAILLTFSSEGQTVRVLADAGVKASGYAKDHVLQKLLEIFGDGGGRIDLIIGTHYDEDHLNGLVPIIEHEDISIGEAWMPPVANDMQSFPVDKRVEASDLLNTQFASDGGGEALNKYLEGKFSDIKTVEAISSDLSAREASLNRVERKAYRVQPAALAIKMDADGLMSFFRDQLDNGDDDHIDHGTEPELDNDPDVAELAKSIRITKFDKWYGPGSPETYELVAYAKILNSDEPDIGGAQLASLANIRKSTAKDAINAQALHEVIQALEKRKIPIRSEIIEDGTPRTFGWDGDLRRFIPQKERIEDIGFTLLGPSRSLVKKHRDRLPVMESAKVALMFRGEIRAITPSNQLSYIGCFGFQGQKILISGDAGCVDFTSGRGTYHQALLDALSTLHIIQVAHHGGNNAHFYRALAAASYPEQQEQSYLLLSHATHDKTRPSDVFREFLLETLGKGDDVKLLFTSEPLPEKVVDFRNTIFQAVGDPRDRGDIGMQYKEGQWSVTKHAIKV